MIYCAWCGKEVHDRHFANFSPDRWYCSAECWAADSARMRSGPNLGPPPKMPDDAEYAAYVEREEMQFGLREPPAPSPQIVVQTMVKHEYGVIERRVDPKKPVDFTNPTGWGRGWWER